MWGEQSKREYNIFMIGASVLFGFVIIGVIFPIVETIMTYFIVGIIAMGALSWLFGRIEESHEMYFYLHATPEEFEKEELRNPAKETVLKREYPPDDLT
jgi:hypothetical protein